MLCETCGVLIPATLAGKSHFDCLLDQVFPIASQARSADVVNTFACIPFQSPALIGRKAFYGRNDLLLSCGLVRWNSAGRSFALSHNEPIVARASQWICLILAASRTSRTKKFAAVSERWWCWALIECDPES